MVKFIKGIGAGLLQISIPSNDRFKYFFAHAVDIWESWYVGKMNLRNQETQQYQKYV